MVSKTKRPLPVPDEVPRRERKFPRGNTVFTKMVGGKWVVSVGSQKSAPHEQLEIGWIVRHRSNFRAKSNFWKYQLDIFTSVDEARQWLKERFDEERMLESTKWAPGGSVRNVRYGGNWNKKGVDRFNPS